MTIEQQIAQFQPKYVTEKYVKAKREDHDDSRCEFDRDAFRQQRVASPEGQVVMEHLASK